MNTVLDFLEKNAGFEKVSKSKNGIYKKDLFNIVDENNKVVREMFEDEKKKMRKQLRKSLDIKLSVYFESKRDTNKLNAFFEKWEKYATSIYNNVEVICESNATESKKKFCTELVNSYKNWKNNQNKTTKK